MSDDYKILDESEIPDNIRSPDKWGKLAQMIATLPEGKWIEVPIKSGEVASHVGISIAQNFRVGRKPFTISYRTVREQNRLFVTRMKEESNGR